MIPPVGLYKRGNKWYARKRVGGRLITKSLKVSTKAEAEAIWRKLEKARTEERLALLDPSRVTLGQLKKQFLTDRAPHVDESTLERYEYALKALAAHIGDGCLLRNITARKLSQWAAIRLQKVKPQTVNSDLRHIKAVLRKAAKWGLIAQAPEVEMVKTPKRLPRHISPEDLQKIIEKETDELRRRLWTFLVWTGLRRSEALGLRWENISGKPKPTMRVIGKGDKERRVPLLPPAFKALGTVKDIGPVWPQVHPSRVSKWFQAAAIRAEVKARLHDLRHTCATYLLSRGVNLKAVQDVLGHSDIRITQDYARAFSGDLYDEMEKAMYDKSIAPEVKA